MASIEQVLACRDEWLSALSAVPPDAAFVEKTLHGCREAVAQLGAQLRALGYPVATFLLPCPAGWARKVRELELLASMPLPKVVREFWRIVGGISLGDVKQFTHVAFWDDRGIRGAHGFCDGVCVEACDEYWQDKTTLILFQLLENGTEAFFQWSLSTDGYGKDGHYHRPPYFYPKDDIHGAGHGFGRGSDWAPTWENIVWSGYRRPDTAVPDPPDFVSYLRTAILECAGFPGLFGHEKFEPIRQDLVRELPPF